jgi:hypothetical protein
MDSGRLLPLTAIGAGIDFIHIFRTVIFAVEVFKRAATSTVAPQKRHKQDSHSTKRIPPWCIGEPAACVRAGTFKHANRAICNTSTPEVYAHDLGGRQEPRQGRRPGRCRRQQVANWGVVGICANVFLMTDDVFKS